MPHYIVTEELKELATNAIKSFKKYAKDVCVISVDDGSPMDTSFLKELSDVYIRNEKNSGFAITCNNGFKWVFEHADPNEENYIICANNDIEINDKVVPALIDPFNRWKDVAFTGIVSTKGRDYEGKPLDQFNWNKITEGGLIRDRMQDGGLWCSTQKVLEKIGIFDEQFIRGGYEDVDIFLRARDTFGMKLIMSGMAAYWHKQGATRWNCENNGYINNFGFESKSIENENLERFIKKWGYNPHSRQIWFEKDIFNS